MDEIKEENRSELVDILDSYFDPEKEHIVPVPKKQNRRHRSFKRGGNGNGSNKENRRSRNNDKHGSMGKRSLETNNNDELEPQTPDSTTTSPQRRQRRFRKRGTNNNRQLTPIKKSESNGNTTNGNTVGATDLTKVKPGGYITVA